MILRSGSGIGVEVEDEDDGEGESGSEMSQKQKYRAAAGGIPPSEAGNDVGTLPRKAGSIVGVGPVVVYVVVPASPGQAERVAGGLVAEERSMVAMNKTRSENCQPVAEKTGESCRGEAGNRPRWEAAAGEAAAEGAGNDWTVRAPGNSGS